MKFNTKQEAVFIKSDNGVFMNEETGQKFEWFKVIFADPITFENHELGYSAGLNLSNLTKGSRVLLEIELEATSKKSRPLVSNFTKVS